MGDKLKKYGTKGWYITGVVVCIVTIFLLMAGIEPTIIDWLKKPMSELSVWSFIMILGIFAILN
jgi:hypothetical protein